MWNDHFELFEIIMKCMGEFAKIFNLQKQL